LRSSETQQNATKRNQTKREEEPAVPELPQKASILLDRSPKIFSIACSTFTPIAYRISHRNGFHRVNSHRNGRPPRPNEIPLASRTTQLLAPNNARWIRHYFGRLLQFPDGASPAAGWSALVLPVLDRFLRSRNSVHPHNVVSDISAAVITRNSHHGELYIVCALDGRVDCCQY